MRLDLLRIDMSIHRSLTIIDLETAAGLNEQEDKYIWSVPRRIWKCPINQICWWSIVGWRYSVNVEELVYNLEAVVQTNCIKSALK